MSKKRKRRERAAATSQLERPAASPAAVAPSEATPSPLVRWALPMFLLLLACYLVLFFTAPDPSLRAAGEKDAKVLRIDTARWLWLERCWQLPRQWTGGSWANVGIGDRLSVKLAALAVLLIALALGWVLVDGIVGGDQLTRLETFVFSLGVGLNGVSLTTLAIGLVGWLQSRWALGSCAAAILIVAGLHAARRMQEPGAADLASDSAPSSLARRASMDWLRPAALWLGLPFVIIIVAGAILPPREFDVREYHLQAPKEWFQHGHIGFVPHNVYANMPLGAEILSLPAMAIMPGPEPWWWGALAGKLIIAAFAPLTALALFAAGRRFFSATAGVAAALIYISIPWIAHVSMEGYIDGVLAGNLFLAIYALLLAPGENLTGATGGLPTGAAPRDGHRPRWRFGFVLLSGFLAGATASNKYTGVLFAIVPLSLLIPVLGWRNATPLGEATREGEAPAEPGVQDSDQSRGWLGGSLALPMLALPFFLIAALIGCGLWYGKNAALAENPTYPLLYGVFGGKTRTPASDAQWRKAHAVPRDEHGQRYSLPQLAASIAQVGVRRQWLSPILWPLAALGIFAPKNRRVALILAGMLLFIFAAWFLVTHRIDRFWLPALPLAALLAGAGVGWKGTPWWRGVMIAILFWGLVWNFLIIAGIAAPPKLLVSLNQLRHDPAFTALGHAHLNKTVVDGSAVLLVGDAEPFDLAMPTLYNTCFDDCLFELWMKDQSKDERLEQLHRRRVSHILVNWSEIERYRSPGNYGFTDYVTPGVFDELLRQEVLVRKQRIRDTRTGQIAELYEVAPP